MITLRLQKVSKFALLPSVKKRQVIRYFERREQPLNSIPPTCA
jgi:hypothetical protein